MSVVNLNVVVLTGNLTHDPELRSTGSGASICKLRLAVNESRKNSTTGEWENRANYFDVTTFSSLADRCAEYLTKGSPVAVNGRLRWSEWTTQDGGKRQGVEVAAERVQFLGTPNGHKEEAAASTDLEPDVPIDDYDFASSAQPTAGQATFPDDDIPF